jgi:predicted DNA-binding transcriptional regulator AlpA
MTEDEVAARFGVKVRTLHRWRSNGSGPPYYKIVGSVRYDKAAVEQWLKEQLRNAGTGCAA